MNTLTLIGGGLGTVESLTLEAREAISSAGRAYTTERLGDAFRGLNPRLVTASYSEISRLIADNQEDMAVIVSGDTGFFSLAAGLRERFALSHQIKMLPGISSMQALCARLGISYEGIRFISTHGRSTSVLGPVSYNSRVVVLTGGSEDTRAVLTELCGAGLSDVQISVGQNLGLPTEKVITGTAENLRDKLFEGLIVLLAENQRAASTHTRLRDEVFFRGKVPMTKEAVRALAVDRLEIHPDHIVYDIGAGTGSVAAALARKACDGLLYAVERDEEGLELIIKNRDRLGTHNVVPVFGSAPDCLADLPAPDRVFIGGSGRRMRDIVDCLLQKGTSFTVCIAAITLESISEAIQALTEKGFRDIEAECVNVSVSREAGRYHMMTAQNQVYLISGRWEASPVLTQPG